MNFSKTALIALFAQWGIDGVTPFVAPASTTQTAFTVRGRPTFITRFSEAEEAVEAAPAEIEIQAEATSTEIPAEIEVAADSSVADEDPVAEVVVDETPDDGEDGDSKKFETKRHSMYVRNLPYDISLGDLKELFSEYASVKYVNMPTKSEDGKNRGFAFVDVGSEEELERVVEQANGIEIGGRPIFCMKSLPKDQIKEQQAARSGPPEDPKRNRKVYVGNLPFGCVEEDITEHFQPYGVVEEILISKKDTGEDKGFGFVVFESEESSQAAIEALDGSEFQGRVLQVSKPLARGEKVPKIEDRKVYVGNLPFGMSEDELTEFFGSKGDVEDVLVAKSEDGEERGFAFITFAKGESAKAAIEELNNQELNGRIIQVSKPLARGVKAPRKAEDPVDIAEGYQRIYLGNLNYETTEEDIREAVSEYGEVVEILMKADGNGRVGYAFVTMDDAGAEKAVAEFNEQEFLGRNVKCQMADKRITKKRIFLGGIDYGTDPETIRGMCEEFATTYNFVMPESMEYGGHKGFAIVSMEAADADKFIEEFQGVVVDDKVLTVGEAKGRGAPKPQTGSSLGTKIYVGNLSFYTPAETLREIFEEFGEVYDVFMPVDQETGSSRGFGFVTMDPDAANTAITNLHDSEIDGRFVVVNVANSKR